MALKKPTTAALQEKATNTAQNQAEEVAAKAAAEAAEAKAAAEASDAQAKEPEPEVETTAQVAEPEVEVAAQAEVEPQPEVEVEPQVEEPASKEVAAVTQTTAVAATTTGVRGAMAQFTEDLAAQGYEGMQLTGMSFDRVKLHENDFKLGSDEISLGQVLDVQIMSTRPLYIVRQYEGNGAEIFYSYDKEGKFGTDGSSAQETLDAWKEDGYGVEGALLNIKEYSEAMAQIVGREDEHEGLMVMLSIPPASRNRLAGAFAVGRQRLHVDPSNLIVRCKVGNKIGSGEEAFRPWVFTALRAVE